MRDAVFVEIFGARLNCVRFVVRNFMEPRQAGSNLAE